MVKENKDEALGKPLEDGEGSLKPPRTEDADKLFKRFSELLPTQEAELEDEDLGLDGNGRGTIEDRMAGSHKLTDLQVADKRLNPDLGNKGKTEYLNVIGMGRTFPESYDAYASLLVKEVVRNTGMSVVEAIAYVNTALSISIDGEGRIDVIAITKGLSEAKSEEEKKKLGLP